MQLSRSGFYEMTPKHLFQKVRRDLERFYDTNEPYDLLDVILGLNHLREWICPEPANQKQAKRAPQTKAQRLFAELDSRSDFEVVRGLSNRAKHFVISKPGPNPQTAVATGGQVGLLACGDALGQSHYVADGEDVRGSVLSVYRVYLEYFDDDSCDDSH